MQLKPGTLLQGGKYKIVRFIKSGGFGCTYEAWHTVFEERVAIKEFFPKDFCNRDDDALHVTVGTQSKKPLVAKLRKKFIDEAKAIRKLSHPGIVKVSDVFEENGTAYYVMDYIEGCSLDDVVKSQGTLSEQAALDYITQACSALSYVHSKNRLHLDLKPGNMMLDESGHVILIDFGTSKQYDEEKGENTSTMMGLTPGYAPLEQYNCGGVTHFSIPTDIYALGATLYKLLVGKTPPEASMLINPAALTLPSELSASVSSAIRNSMLPLPENRPQSVADFLMLLEASDSEVTQCPGGGPKPNEKLPVYYQNGILFVHGVEYPMVDVDGGTFMMGNETMHGLTPEHEVTVDAYSIGCYQVTQDIWEAVMGDNPSCFKGSRRPVECVSWYDCQDFIRKLNDMTGENFRLPTEAEWEYAAKGGQKSHGGMYSGGDAIDDFMWHSGNSGKTTHGVGEKLPNELGLYDMSGNVWEWCSDWHGSYQRSVQTNPKGPDKGMFRVNRGGGCDSDSRSCRIYVRSYDSPGIRHNIIGFRLCL